MLLLPLIITSGLLLLFLPGLSYALLVQPQQYKPIRQNHLLLAKSTRYTRIISMVPTKQAPVGSTTNESVLTVISDNPPKFDRRQQVITEIGIAFAQKIYELEEFQREHGHCLVPKRYSINPSLGNWVNKQRQNYRRHLMGENTALNEKRISALNKIGFIWNTTSIPIKSTYSEKSWQKMYNQLSEFHAIHNHCRVQSTTILGQWVVRQRFLYRQHPIGEAKSSLSIERIRLLNDLNFQWVTRSEEIWNERMSELREFKQQHGHALVPRNYPNNPQLSSWVATQRKNYNRRLDGKPSPLTMARVKELDEIGFVWSYWDHNFMVSQKDRLL